MYDCQYESEQRELAYLYEQAKRELQTSGGKLTIWAGGDEPHQQDELVQQFKERFPGIEVDLKVDLSKYHDIKVYQELLDGKLTPDVVMLQTMNDFENWKAMGVLEPFYPQSFSYLKAGYGDPEGYFHPVFMFAFLPQYDPAKVEKIPTSYLDFLRPEYKDRLVLTPPHDDDAVLFVYDQIIRVYGACYLKKLKDQNPTWIRGTAAPAYLVGKKDFLGNITGYPTSEANSQSFIPKDDFFVTWPQRAAMFKLTRHKAAARLWLAYLMSYEYQSKRSAWSTRWDVAPPKGLKPLECYRNTSPYAFIEFMRDRKRLAELRQLMTEIFGPVEGESPLTDPKVLGIFEK